MLGGLVHGYAILCRRCYPQCRKYNCTAVSASFLLIQDFESIFVVVVFPLSPAAIFIKQEVQQVHDSSDMMDGIKSRTGCSIELLDLDDPRAALCPKGQRLLRVAGGRDQVGLGYSYATLRQT